jgi:hypothetical protein
MESDAQPLSVAYVNPLETDPGGTEIEAHLQHEPNYFYFPEFSMFCHSLLLLLQFVRQ